MFRLKLERFQSIIARLFPRIKFPGLLRVSLGIGNTEEEVDTLIRVLRKIANSTGAKVRGHAASSPDNSALLTKKETGKQINDFVRTAALRVYSEPV